MLSAVLVTAVGAVLAAAAPVGRSDSPTPRGPAEREARAFLEMVSALYQPVYRVAAEAGWRASTDVSPARAGERAGAEKSAAALLGSKAVIEKARTLLALERRLDPLTVRQLRRLLLTAAENPGTVAEVVARRAEAEAEQARIAETFTFCLDAPPVGAPGAAPPDATAPAATPRRCARPASATQLDAILRRSPSLDERARAWSASKEVGGALKPGLEALVPLRNQIAREMGYPSFFALQVADYGMTITEMSTLLEATLQAIAPLYDGLHCWARHTLAARFGQPVPRLLPAHWLGNRWAASWPGLVEGVDLDPLLASRSPESIVRQAEAFFVSLGFARLPDGFWQKSDLFPLPPGSTRRKSGLASSWHVDGDQDVRALMNIEASQPWFGAAHHELGHIYYYLAYARPDVPFLLRTGANRAFHEAVGELFRLASLQPPYLRRIGVLRGNDEPEAASWLLSEALEAIVFLPFAAGTVPSFERDLYEATLPASEWQARWWQYAQRMQGVSPPGARPHELCDACTKTQLHTDPARYYDYALATLIKFQLHDHICRKILRQDVHACDYTSSGAVGDFLRSILRAGATRDWRRLLRETTGEEIGPRALVEYFAPLPAELERRNQGKDCARP
jgi:peptidyl-dipeptidase A